MKVESLLRELEAAGSKLDETDKACYLLLNMPEQYDVVITAIETVSTTISLEFELKSKETCEDESKDKSCAFHMNTRKYNSSSRNCSECREVGYFIRECPKKNKKMEDRQKVEQKRGKRGRQFRGKGKQANIGWTEEEEETGITSLTEILVAEEKSRKVGERNVEFI